MKSFWMGIKSFLRRGKTEQELDEEMRFHLEMQEQAFVDKGMDREVARREALKAFGGVELHKEVYRDRLGLGFVMELLKDGRFALRRAVENKGYSFGVVMMYAFGIGITATVFTLFDVFVLKPLPFDDPEQLVALRERNLELGYKQFSVSNPNYLDWVEGLDTFEALAAMRGGFASLGLEGSVAGARSVNRTEATHRLFDLLRVRMAMGRAFFPEDDAPGAPGVAVITHKLWQSEFKGDEAVVGEVIRLDGQSKEVVGVLPEWYDRAGVTEVYTPLSLEYRDRLDHRLQVWGRIKEGVSFEQASEDLNRVMSGIVEDHPAEMEGWDAFLIPMKTYIFGDTQENAKILLASVSLLMLIVCLNVSGMNLAQSSKRIHEFAIRVSLGASRWRVFRQLVTENLLLSFIGVGLSVIVALFGLKLVVGYMPGDLVDYGDFSISLRTLAVMGGLAALSSLVGGIFPMTQVLKVNQNDTMKTGGRTVATGRNRLFQALVVGEIALALVVVVGGALLMDGYRKILDQPLGFDSKGVSTARIQLSPAKYANFAEKRHYMRALVDELEAGPAITRAAWVSDVPYSGMDTMNSIDRPDGSVLEAGEQISARWRIAGPEFFESLGIRILHGRGFEIADGDREELIVTVSVSLAKRLWGETDVIGRSLGKMFGNRPTRIVGVVEDVSWRSESDSTEALYISLEQNYWWNEYSLVMNFQGDADVAQGELMRAARKVDHDQALAHYQTMDELVSSGRSNFELSMIAMNLFGALALMLSLTGVYGLSACVVSKQQREIGIRCSLGAVKGTVIAGYLWNSVRLGVIGIICGSLGALLFARGMGEVMGGVDIFRPSVFVVVAVALLLTVAFATYVPVGRALRANPLDSLRVE